MDNRKELTQYRRGDKYFYGGETLNFYDILETKYVEINIVSMIKGLTSVPRWNGQTKDRMYVSQHSMDCLRKFRFEVSQGYHDNLTEHEQALAELLILLHDAHEYICGDISTPVKQMCAKIKRIELIADKCIRKLFLINESEHKRMIPIIKRYDTLSLHNEWNNFYGENRSLEYYSGEKKAVEMTFANELHTVVNNFYRSKGLALTELPTKQQDLIKTIQSIANYGII